MLTKEILIDEDKGKGYFDSILTRRYKKYSEYYEKNKDDLEDSDKSMIMLINFSKKRVGSIKLFIRAIYGR